MLCKLIYASRAVRPLDDRVLTDLLGAARVYNEAQEITGMLLYADQSFVQILEGEQSEVSRLFAQIKVGLRHHEIREFGVEPIAARRFQDWAMGFAHPDRDWMRQNIEGYRSIEELPLWSQSLIRNAQEAEGLLSICAAA
ncbi:MAG: hypothetical protein CMN28_09205 [Salinisphaeraceae bacterium]|nr:hypothetical protein [Salinisphaeraceae bacterium]